MPKTQEKTQEKAQELLYAAVGAGEFAVDKVRSLQRFSDRDANMKLYKDFIARGRKVSRKVRTSPVGKEVTTRTEAARTRVEDASKSVGKALGVNIVSWPKPRKATSRSNGSKKKTTRKTTAKAS